MNRWVTHILLVAVFVTSAVPFPLREAQAQTTPNRRPTPEEIQYFENYAQLSQTEPEVRAAIGSVIFSPSADFFAYLDFPRSPTDAELGLPKDMQMPEAAKGRLSLNQKITAQDLGLPAGADVEARLKAMDQAREAAYQAKLEEAYKKKLKERQASNHDPMLKDIYKAARKRTMVAYGILKDPRSRTQYIGSLQKKEYARQRLSLLPEHVPTRGEKLTFYAREHLMQSASGNLGFMFGAAAYTLLKAQWSGDPAMMWAAIDSLREVEGLVSLAGFSIGSDIASHVLRLFKVGPNKASMFGMAFGSLADHFVAKFMATMNREPTPVYFHKEHGKFAKLQGETESKISRIISQIRTANKNGQTQVSADLEKQLVPLRAERQEYETKTAQYRRDYWNSLMAKFEKVFKWGPGEKEQLLIHGSQMLLTSQIVHMLQHALGRKISGAEAAAVEQTVLKEVAALPVEQRPISVTIKHLARKKSFFNPSNWKVTTSLRTLEASATKGILRRLYSAALKSLNVLSGTAWKTMLAEMEMNALGRMTKGLGKSSLNAIAFLGGMDALAWASNPLIYTLLMKYELMKNEQELQSLVDRFVDSQKDEAELYKKIDAVMEARMGIWNKFRENAVKAKMNEHMANWQKEIDGFEKRFAEVRNVLPWLARGASFTDPEFCANGGRVDTSCKQAPAAPADPAKAPATKENVGTLAGVAEDAKPADAPKDQAQLDLEEAMEEELATRAWHIDSQYTAALQEQVDRWKRQWGYLLEPYQECMKAGGKKETCPNPELLIMPIYQTEYENYVVGLDGATEEKRQTMTPYVEEAFFTQTVPKRVSATLYHLPSFAELKPSFNLRDSYVDEIRDYGLVFKRVLDRKSLKPDVGAFVLETFTRPALKMPEAYAALLAFATPPLFIEFATPENKLPPYTRDQKADALTNSFAKAAWTTVDRAAHLMKDAVALLTSESATDPNQVPNPFESSEGALRLVGRNLRDPEKKAGFANELSEEDLEGGSTVPKQKADPKQKVAEAPGQQPPAEGQAQVRVRMRKSTKAEIEKRNPGDPAKEEAAEEAALQKRLDEITARQSRDKFETLKKTGMYVGAAGSLLMAPMIIRASTWVGKKVFFPAEVAYQVAIAPAAFLHEGMKGRMEEIERFREGYIDRFWDAYIRDEALMKTVPGILQKARDILNKACIAKGVSKWGCIAPSDKIFLSPDGNTMMKSDNLYERALRNQEHVRKAMNDLYDGINNAKDQVRKEIFELAHQQRAAGRARDQKKFDELESAIRKLQAQFRQYDAETSKVSLSRKNLGTPGAGGSSVPAVWLDQTLQSLHKEYLRYDEEAKRLLPQKDSANVRTWQVVADHLLYPNAAEKIAAELAESLFQQFGVPEYRGVGGSATDPVIKDIMSQLIKATFSTRQTLDRNFSYLRLQKKFGQTLAGLKSGEDSTIFYKFRTYSADLNKRLEAAEKAIGSVQNLEETKFRFRSFTLAKFSQSDVFDIVTGDKMARFTGGTKAVEMLKVCESLKQEVAVAELGVIEYFPKCESIAYKDLLSTDMIREIYKAAGSYTSKVDAAPRGIGYARSFAIAAAISRIFGRSTGSRIKIALVSGVTALIAEAAVTVLFPDQLDNMGTWISTPWQDDRARVRKFAHVLNVAQASVKDKNFSQRKFEDDLIKSLNLSQGSVSLIREK